MKKGQVQVGFNKGIGAILTFLLIVLLLMTVALVMGGIRTSVTTYTASSTYENFTGVNGTAVSLANCCNGYQTITQYVLKNTSGGNVVDTSNYTIDTSAGTVTIDPDVSIWNINLNTTYNISTQDLTYQYNITDKGLQGVNNWSNYNPLVGTLIAVMIILAILISIFAVYMSRKN